VIRVLLADDHAVVRDGLRMVLEAQPDINVVGDAANGKEAVRQAEELQPDIVIMDILMSELNGIEATRKICEVNPNTRIVILTMHTSCEHVHRALKAGAEGYVLKESAGREVVNAVRLVHGGHRYLSQKIMDTMVDEYIRLREDLPEKSPLERLTPREREVLQLVVEGKSSKEIGKILFLSPKTVETYRSRLMGKLGVENLTNLIRFAVEHGLTSSEP